MSRVIYGRHAVEEALRRRGGQVQGLFLARQGRTDAASAAAEARRIPVHACGLSDLDELCGVGNHQGIAAVVGDYAYLDLETLLAGQGDTPLLLVLDSVTDPQNLGAIMRSALVLGASGIVIPRDRAAPVTPTVVKVSAGASEHLPCAQVTNLARALEQLKAAGIWVVGAVERGGQPPEAIDLGGPVALVLGSEGKGIRPLVRRGCDLLLSIPAASSMAALNVATAAAVILYEAARQRRASAGFPPG